MKKRIFRYVFVSMLLYTGLLVGGSSVHAAEMDSSTIVYDYVDVNTLTKEQKDSIIKGTPNEIHKNDYETYQFVYQKNSSQRATNSVDNPSGNNQLLKTGDSGINIFLIILGLLLVGGGISLFARKRGRGKKILLFLVVFGGSSILAGSLVQATESSSLKPEEKVVSSKGVKETKEPESIPGYTYVGYLHTVKNDNPPAPIQKGKVIVNYQDEKGTSIAPSETLEGDIGQPYQISAKEITGYEEKEVEGNTTGTYMEETQTVVYIYEKLPIAAANVMVNYLDEDGKQIHDSQTISGNIGDSYDASTPSYQLEIAGYTLDNDRLPNNEKGTLSEQTQEVNYIYRKELQEVTITIRFVDRDDNPFVLDDLTTYKDGSLVPLYPNLDQYHMLLDYNQQVYNQGEQVPDIVLDSKEGETYSLPEKMTFSILDNQGNPVDYVASPNANNSVSGIRYWQNYRSTPANREGTLTSEDIVVTYQILRYGILIPAP
ncbi:MucBP domain-containing protein [Listeria ivanovii]|uniref:MucBP domain-containing protein n=2 Tax=Listeria ivanovii TaxID=1638 RepID=UPI0016251BA2|nr:MucBP domain-containing protein [Listeria ivanovii]MBC2255689.1 MucBP domain-containing protein [Listeria ivanovii]